MSLSIQIAVLLGQNQTSATAEKAVLECMKSIIQHGPTAMRAAVSHTPLINHALLPPVLGAIELVDNVLRSHSSARAWSLAWPDAVQSIVQTVRDVAVLLPKNVDHYDFFHNTISRALDEIYVQNSVIIPLLEHKVDLHIAVLKINLASVSRQLAENACEKNIFDLQWMKGMSYLVGDSSIKVLSNTEWHRAVPYLIRSLQLACRVIATVPISVPFNMDNIFLCGIFIPMISVGLFGSSWVWMFRCVRWTTKLIAFQYEMKRQSGISTSERCFFPTSNDVHLKICSISLEGMRARPDIGKRRIMPWHC